MVFTLLIDLSFFFLFSFFLFLWGEGLSYICWGRGHKKEVTYSYFLSYMTHPVFNGSVLESAGVISVLNKILG